MVWYDAFPGPSFLHTLIDEGGVDVDGLFPIAGVEDRLHRGGELRHLLARYGGKPTILARELQMNRVTLRRRRQSILRDDSPSAET